MEEGGGRGRGEEGGGGRKGEGGGGGGAPHVVSSVVGSILPRTLLKGTSC